MHADAGRGTTQRPAMGVRSGRVLGVVVDASAARPPPTPCLYIIQPGFWDFARPRQNGLLAPPPPSAPLSKYLSRSPAPVYDLALRDFQHCPSFMQFYSHGGSGGRREREKRPSLDEPTLSPSVTYKISGAAAAASLSSNSDSRELADRITSFAIDIDL